MGDTKVCDHGSERSRRLMCFLVVACSLFKLIKKGDKESRYLATKKLGS